jgi:Na+-driven multidrug efflux pump
MVWLEIAASILAILAISYGAFSLLAIRQQQTQGIERRKISFTIAFIAASFLFALSTLAFVFAHPAIALGLQTISLLVALYGMYVRLQRITWLTAQTQKEKGRRKK